MSKSKITLIGPEKIFYHPEILNKILNGEHCFPIHLHLGLVNYCNHNCRFCYAYWQQKRKEQINKNRLREILEEMQLLGLKAVTVCGSGEPTLHPDFYNIIVDIHTLGLEVGLLTNGSRLETKTIDMLADVATFVRFSFTGGIPSIHKMVHGSSDFEKVTENLQKLIQSRGARLFPTIGVQFILTSYSLKGLLPAVKLAKELGADYFAVKPCLDPPQHLVTIDNKIDIEIVNILLYEVMQFHDKNFTVFTKEPQHRNILLEQGKKNYTRCVGGSIRVIMEQDYKLYHCPFYMGPEDCLGDVSEQTFRSVWSGKPHIDFLNKLDLDKCTAGCIHNELNKLLETLIHNKGIIKDNLIYDPFCHPNFI
jgi:MoaA/NifB/PqqE/SkfB family radical SAM enzyme